VSGNLLASSKAGAQSRHQETSCAEHSELDSADDTAMGGDYGEGVGESSGAESLDSGCASENCKEQRGKVGTAKPTNQRTVPLVDNMPSDCPSLNWSISCISSSAGWGGVFPKNSSALLSIRARNVTVGGKYRCTQVWNECYSCWGIVSWWVLERRIEYWEHRGKGVQIIQPA
jgi:hypothetical protein